MVVDLLREAMVDRDPTRVALIGRDRSWTFAELDRGVDQRTAELRSEGLIPGRVYSVAIEATIAGVIEMLAASRLGAPIAPLNRRLTERERRVAMGRLDGEASEAQVILWTSGTSGEPRGVELSYHNLRASAEGAAKRLDLGEDDVWLASLSPAHVGGLALITRSLILGGALVLNGPFDASLVSAWMDGAGGPNSARRALTHMSLVPTQLLRLLDRRADRPPPPTFRCALIGGAHAPSRLIDRALAAGWPVALTYGMTEMTSQVATASPASVRRRPECVGQPLAGVDVRIGDGEEILTRGPTLAMGYFGSPAAIADSGGWYATGDLGRIDEAGDLWVTGRRSDRIISGGVTVDASEVENAVRAHPTVHDVCVVGLPSEEWGETVAAVVVPVEGEFDLDILDSHVRERLAGARRPRAWAVTDQLPRNANGKVDRAAVRGLFPGENRND